MSCIRFVLQKASSEFPRQLFAQLHPLGVFFFTGRLVKALAGGLCLIWRSPFLGEGAGFCRGPPPLIRKLGTSVGEGGGHSTFSCLSTQQKTKETVLSSFLANLRVKKHKPGETVNSDMNWPCRFGKVFCQLNTSPTNSLCDVHRTASVRLEVFVTRPGDAQDPKSKVLFN